MGNPSASLPRRFSPSGLGRRVTLFFVLFTVEWVLLLTQFPPAVAGSMFLRLGVFCGAFLLLFVFTRTRNASRAAAWKVEPGPIRWDLLTLHIAAVGAFLLLSSDLADAAAAPDTWLRFLRFLAGVLTVAFAGFALIPPCLAWRVARSVPAPWLGGGILVLTGWAVISVPQQVGDYMWNGRFMQPATGGTFTVVKGLLGCFLPEVVADRATMTIGSPTFSVTVGWPCAGFEGIALILVFSSAWLIVRRREFRFPLALLLIPVGVAAMWTANALRITALILIGVAGAPQIAMTGFHSEAGWIAFNCVALVFILVTERIPALTSSPVKRQARPRLRESTTAAYLFPLLAILAAGMVSRAASSDFEWLYPLRLVAAAAVLWFFRSTYARMDWTPGWTAALLGAGAFAIWIALVVVRGPQTADGVTRLASLPAWARIGWLGCRVVAGVFTMPIAEELAFRGFLIRYLVPANPKFLTVRAHTYIAVVVSSVAFGLLHGNDWLAGTIVGIIYAAAFCRRGRVSDATIAHATTNALLVGWIAWTGEWSAW